MTTGDPVFRSAIAEAAPAGFDSPELELRDLSGLGVTLVQGDVGEVLKTRWPDLPDQPGAMTDVGGALLGRLTSREFYLFARLPSAALPSVTELNESFARAGRSAHATDHRHGKAVLKLSGSAASETLSKICGLDFDDKAFSNMQIRQTSAAKIKTLIARCDEHGTRVYFLHVNRPFGQYFWDTVSDAALEFRKENTP